MAQEVTSSGFGRWVDQLWGFTRGHVVDIAFGLLVAVSVGYRVRMTRNSYFSVDDWPLLSQAGRGEFLEPYNEHLSIVILGLWRFLAEVGGFTYWPFRTVSMMALGAISVAIYVAVRLKLGPLFAAIIATATLWTGSADLFPANMNHYLVLCCAVVCAVALDRGPRADIVLLLATGLALASAGGGIAVAGACLVHNACTRAPVRRWMVVLVPLGLWVAWFVTYADPSDATGGDGSLLDRVLDSIVYARDLMHEATGTLVVGWSPVGVLFVLAFVAYGVWLLRKGADHAANFLAWTAGVLAWSFGLTSSRSLAQGVFGDGIMFTFRYVLTAWVFMILAFLPRRRVDWGSLRATARPMPRWLGVGATVLVLLFMGGRAMSVRSDYERAAAILSAIGKRAQTVEVVLGAGPEVFADDLSLPFFMGTMEAGEVRQVLDDYGVARRTGPAEADRRLVEEGLFAARVSAEGERECAPFSRGLRFEGELLADAFGTLRLWSDQPVWEIEVRGVGTEWVPLYEGRAGQVVTVRVPDSSHGIPWDVRAEGACLVEG